jgi:hypothetical protein
MIISAGRRTDVPAFYAGWFINRIRAGFCTVPNPFNRHQVAYVSLQPCDVDAIVFWTRNPQPLLCHLPELDRLGYRSYFQYTVMDNPRPIDPHAPALATSLQTFRDLVSQVGPQRVIWRYDPIVVSQASPIAFHHRTFEHIARALGGHTGRCVISLVDRYRKTEGRLRQLAADGIDVMGCDEALLAELIPPLVQTAHDNGMEIVSCAEEIDLQPYGVRPGKCVDDEYIAQTFGIEVSGKKDPAQRAVCGCVVSKDIGMYDTCLFGCQYCYATSSFERAKINHDQEHDPRSPSLLGWHEAQPQAQQAPL